MFKSLNTLMLILLIPLVVVTNVFSQGKPYEGPEDGAGDKAVERKGYMEGNSVRCQFRNTTELSDWGTGTDPYATKWPNDFRGSKMNDGIGLLIGTLVFLEKNTNADVDSIPVDNPDLIASLNAQGLLDTLYFLQTSYREEQDTDPTGQIEWNLYPPRGYLNLNIPDVPPAISNRPESWPSEGWPSRGFEKKWPGEWNGRFGRGVYKADLECFFVANDAQDQEYLQDTARVKYYPRPGKVIGDFDPKVTIQRGLPWGGVGVRVELRGFQWNNPQARDAIFWEYNVANVSDYNLTKVAFGYWVDNAIGNDSNDEFAAYDTKLDLAYSWDQNGVGTGGLKVGTMGFAYLESPANSGDGIDNDEDGLIDEKRDNKLVGGETKIGPLDGIADLAKFLDFYKLQESDLKEHYAVDEDQDWDDGVDANGNGVYDVGENPGDDVGLDGVGPGEINYTGPDADETECNHKPDLLEGYGCEPDFGLVDISESDMLGLTSFRLFPIPEHVAPFKWWFRNDESMWELVGLDSLVPYIDKISNLAEVFATGVFPLYRGRTEHISMSELHSWDDGANIKATDPVTNPPLSLFRLKEIVQVIYEKDYRFALPPIMPTLKATAGDGYVLLTWDNISEIFTRDSFVNNENDFEGYKLYRASDRDFTDAKKITSGLGDPTDSKKPIFQCDKINMKKGFTEFGLVDGMAFYLGNDTGITHSYRDENVQNGRTYYYALVAYDYGIEDIGVAPTENNVVINIDRAEQITFTSRNVAIAVPHQIAAGYKSEQNVSVSRPENTVGAGTVLPEVISGGAMKKDAIYKVTFDVHSVKNIKDLSWGLRYVNSGFKIWDATKALNLIYQENPDNPGTALIDSIASSGYYFIGTGDVVTDLFDGLRLHIQTPVQEAVYNRSSSGWTVGTGMMRVTFTQDETPFFPWDYDIAFTDNPEAYKSDFNIGKSWRVRDENSVLISENLLSNLSFKFYAVNTSITDSLTKEPTVMEFIVHDLNKNGVYDQMQDRIFVGALTTGKTPRWGGTAFIIDFAEAQTEDELPKSGDVYKIKFNRPFWTTDTLTFSASLKESLIEDDIAEGLKKVKVVPNPYIATNALEPALANTNFNQRRRIMFTHVPAQCTIKIFSVSGVFIDEINVENANDNGIAYWDLLTKDRIELAAGMYVYHLKATKTGDEIMGKFAIIK